MSKKDTAIHCLKSSCDKSVITVLPDNLVKPFDCDREDLMQLFSYFLYEAPDIESAHKSHIDKSKHEQVFNAMLQDRHFDFSSFYCERTTIEDELEKRKMHGKNICLKCKRFVCRRKYNGKNEAKETNLDYFLRHIRNSLAHGWVYYHHAGNKMFLVFDDFSKKKRYTARIICIKADLEHWKKLLEKETRK